MPAKLNAPLEKTFQLEKTDQELGNTGEPTTVTVRQARRGEQASRQALFEQFSKNYNASAGVTTTQIFPTMDQIERLEVYLTLTACNLEGVDGKPLFKFPMSERDFINAWNILPEVAATEIHDKVLEINPQWSDQGESL